MDDQFSLDFYKNADLNEKIIEIIMGQVIFVKTEWSSPVTKLGFYVDTCQYSCGDNSIDIIKVYNKIGSHKDN